MTRKDIKKTAFSTFLALSVALSGFFMFSDKTNVYAQERPLQYEVEIPSLVNGDQGNTELCWIYATTKMLESYYYSSTNPHQTINISEDWISLAYMYYVNDPNQTLTENDKVEYIWGATGQPFYYQHVLNAYGFVEEDDWILTETVTKDNYKTLFQNSLQFAQNDVFSNLEFDWLGYKVINDYTYNNDNIVLCIKDLILNGFMLYSATASVPYKEANGFKYVYYEDVTIQPGHAMTIVGYDDTFQVTENNETLMGAFKILNSYGENNQYYYLPYKMFESIVVEDTETNKLLSNSCYVKNLDIILPSTPQPPDGNDPVNPPSGEETEPDNPNTPPSGDGNQPETPPNDEENDPVVPPSSGDNPVPPEDAEPVVPPSDSEDITIEVPNFIDVFNQKNTTEKVFVLFGVSAGVIFAGTAIGFALAVGIRRARTNSLNQQVLAKTLSDYQAHKYDMQKKEKELQEHLEDLKKVQERKKQRRLKRKFYDNLSKKS